MYPAFLVLVSLRLLQILRELVNVSAQMYPNPVSTCALEDLSLHLFKTCRSNLLHSAIIKSSSRSAAAKFFSHTKMFPEQNSFKYSLPSYITFLKSTTVLSFSDVQNANFYFCICPRSQVSGWCKVEITLLYDRKSNEWLIHDQGP